MITMGTRIRELRTQMGLTQTELGDRVGVGKSAILKYENGDVENIPRDTILKMAMLFNVTPSYLMAFDQLDEEELIKEVRLIDQIQKKYGKRIVKILEHCSKLNDHALTEIEHHASDLTLIEKYKR